MPARVRDTRFVHRAPEDISVRAIRFKQGSDENPRIMFATALPMSVIRQCWGVDIWTESGDDGEEKGYQRKPLPSRVRQVADYVARPDALLPIGGLANYRAENLTWRPDPGARGEGPESGTLTLPKGSTLWIVDAQHRILGLTQAIEEDDVRRLDDFVLPLTIAVGMDQQEEARQFELINTTQKRVETALARRLLAARGGDNWEARGAAVAGLLNRDRSGVWYRHIIAPNESRKTMPYGWAKETSFVTSLKPVLQLPAFRSSSVTNETIKDALDRYWTAISRAWPEAFRPDKSGSFLIHRTPGLFSLHGLFPLIWEYGRQETRGEGSEEEVLALYVRVFKALRRELGDGFWLAAAALRSAGGRTGTTAASFGTGMAAFKQLQEYLEEHLDIEIRL